MRAGGDTANVTPDPATAILDRFASLRQHQSDGHRSPHKPLLVLLALGRLASTGRSDLPWSDAESLLADLVAEFGRPSRTGRRQSATYPYTRLRFDYVWVLDHDVPMDNAGPLAADNVTGRFEHSVEAALAGNPGLLNRVACSLVDSQFPPTIAHDVLLSVGLSPGDVLGTGRASARVASPSGARIEERTCQGAAMMKCGTEAAARIVVGLDGSPASVAALRWAIREARFTGCTVEVVHVWTASVSPFDLAHARAGVQSERDAAREVLLTAVAQARDANPDGDVPVREELVAGYPVAVLRAKGRIARMVVLGDPRDSNRTRLLHKTVTHAVTRDAPCRVVIVAADGSLVRDSALPSART